MVVMAASFFAGGSQPGAGRRHEPQSPGCVLGLQHPVERRDRETVGPAQTNIDFRKQVPADGMVAA
jgi:hypothetical protein